MVSFTVPPWMWRWTLPRSKKMFPCPLGFVFYLLHISLYKLLLAIVLVLVVTIGIFQGKPGAWQHRAQTHWSSSAGLVSTVSYTTAACSSVKVLCLIKKFFSRQERRNIIQNWVIGSNTMLNSFCSRSADTETQATSDSVVASQTVGVR